MSSLIPETELRDHLLKENAEYRKLAIEHQSYDNQLEDLASKHFLSKEDELLEKTLKKRKLALKDQMFSIVQQYRKEMEGQS